MFIALAVQFYCISHQSGLTEGRLSQALASGGVRWISSEQKLLSSGRWALTSTRVRRTSTIIFLFFGGSNGCFNLGKLALETRKKFVFMYLMPTWEKNTAFRMN